MVDAMRRPAPGRSTSSLRALEILGTFDAHHRRQTLSEIAARAGLAPATAFRLVGVLTGWGALRRGDDKRYEIGTRLWQLGLLTDVRTELGQAAAPFLQDLFMATHETVFLAVRKGTRALYVDRVSGRGAPRLAAQVGSMLPLHATGVGKVLLAHAPAEVLAQVESSLIACTPNTITDPRALRLELAAVRIRGVATTVAELDLGTATIAVPVVDAEGSVVAALSLVTSQLRRDVSRLLPAVRLAAQGISRTLAAGSHASA